MDTLQVRPPATRIVSLLVGLASIFIIIWGINWSTFILNPILLAAVITITVMPIPERLMKRGWKGWTSLLAAILAVVGVLAVVVIIITYSIASLSAKLPTYQAEIEARQASEAASGIGAALSAIDISLSAAQLDQLAATMIYWVGQSVFMIFITMMIFGFMMSAAITTPQLRGAGDVLSNLPMRRVETLTGEVRRYMSIMTLINFLVALGDTILLMIIGVDYALLWGIISWFLGYIPSVGFWLALIPPVILAWAQFGVEEALIVFLGYVLINGSVQNIIQPKLMGEGLKISPVVVFISVFFWGWVLGGLGAILAVPLTLLVLEILEGFDSSRWLVQLLRAAPDQKPGEQKAAAERVRGIWDRIRGDLGGKAIPPEPPPAVKQEEKPVKPAKL